MAGRLIEPLIRLAISLVFAGAAVAKIADPEAFAWAVHAYRLTPWAVSAGLALYLPWVELLAALLVWRRRSRHGALAVLLALVLVFLAAMISARVRDLPIGCGCLGPGALPGGLWGSIALDVVLLAGIVYCIARHLAERRRPPRVLRTVLFQ